MVNNEIPSPRGLTRDPVSAFLGELIRGAIGNPLDPSQALSQRGFARLVGISESTLRTAFRTEGRAPSQRTLDRLDTALRRMPQSLFAARTVGPRTVRENMTPLGSLYYKSTKPAGARSFRIVVETEDPSYRYKTLLAIGDPRSRPEDFFDDIEASGQYPVSVIWDVS